MGKSIIVAIISLIILAASCSEHKGDRTSDIHTQVLELMQTVPSDALAVICRDKCSEAIEMLDSTNILQKLRLEGLENAPAAISLTYEGRIRTNISIDAGRKATDSTFAVKSLLLQAERLKMQGRFIPSGEGRNAFVIITPSESQMNAVLRHMSEGRSILEADKFQQALHESEGAKDLVVIRNEGASRLIQKNAIGGMFNPRELRNFVASFSEWILLLPQRGTSFQIKSIQGESGSYFANMMASLPGKKMDIASVAPDTTELLISMAIQEDAFRDAYESYMDASVRLNSYRNTLKGLKNASGKDPLKWEKELGIQEIALMKWNGEKMLLIHSGSKTKESEIMENPYHGFAEALFGSAFRVDDSFYTRIGKWYIFGSKKALTEYCTYFAARNKKHKPSPPDRLIIASYGGWRLEWNKKEIILWK